MHRDNAPSKRIALTLVGLALAVVVLDLVTKELASSRLDEPADLPLGFELELSHNSGIAFGLLTGAPSAVLITIAALFSVGLLLGVWRYGLPWWPVALLLGGAIANVVDRLGDGSVTDFLSAPGWPSFNVADAAITAGAVTLALLTLLADRQRGA